MFIQRISFHVYSLYVKSTQWYALTENAVYIQVFIRTVCGGAGEKLCSLRRAMGVKESDSDNDYLGKYYGYSHVWSFTAEVSKCTAR